MYMVKKIIPFFEILNKFLIILILDVKHVKINKKIILNYIMLMIKLLN